MIANDAVIINGNLCFMQVFTDTDDGKLCIMVDDSTEHTSVLLDNEEVAALRAACDRHLRNAE